MSLLRMQAVTDCVSCAETHTGWIQISVDTQPSALHVLTSNFRSRPSARTRQSSAQTCMFRPTTMTLSPVAFQSDTRMSRSMSALYLNSSGICRTVFTFRILRSKSPIRCVSSILRLADPYPFGKPGFKCNTSSHTSCDSTP